MKPEVFSDKMRNDTVFKAEFDRNNKYFLHKWIQYTLYKGYKNSIVGVYLFSVGGMMMPFDDMKILRKEASASVFTK